MNIVNEIKGKPLTSSAIETLLRTAYDTGNYNIVTSRIDMSSGFPTLELDFHQKNRNTIYVGFMQTFEGSLSSTASWDVNFATSLQFRNFNNFGTVFSVQGRLLNTSGLELMLLQPLTNRTFLRAKANGFIMLDNETSGFEIIEVSNSQFQYGTAALAYGYFFSHEHKLLNEIGLHWIDTTQVQTDNIDAVLHRQTSQHAFTFDVSSRYTLNTLNSLVLPTRGVYNDLKVKAVFPLWHETSLKVFDSVSTDFALAIPFSEKLGLAINSFIGTNISEGLKDEAELMTKYGFTTYDRGFFPHVMQRYVYGIHKLALKMDLQFYPLSASILGGSLITGVGGAMGGVWDTYSALTEFSFNDLEWQTSAFAGLRISNNIGVILRTGAGNYSNDILPFVSLDFMVKHY